MTSPATRKSPQMPAADDTQIFRYTDYSLGPVLYKAWVLGRPMDVHAGEVIFECEAPDILSADAKLKEATGIVAEKAANIGCGWSASRKNSHASAIRAEAGEPGDQK